MFPRLEIDSKRVNIIFFCLTINNTINLNAWLLRQTHTQESKNFFFSVNFRYEILNRNLVCFLFSHDVNFPIVELDASLDVSIWSKKSSVLNKFPFISLLTESHRHPKIKVIKLKRSQMSKTTLVSLILFEKIETMKKYENSTSL